MLFMVSVTIMKISYIVQGTKDRFVTLHFSVNDQSFFIVSNYCVADHKPSDESEDGVTIWQFGHGIVNVN